VEEAYLGASIEGGEANDAEAVAARSPR